MSEWSSHINPFNSLKSLVWAERYEMLAKGEIPQPVSVTIDPTNRCQLNCPFCHYASWRAENPAHPDTKDLLGLARMIVGWHIKGGPRAVCVAGGGEPLLHAATPELIRILVEGGLQVGMITNGVNLQGDFLEAATLCRWVGFSVDAGNAESYAKQKGTIPKNFAKVLESMSALSNLNALNDYSPRPTIGFKFLLQPNSINEVVDAARLAKEFGANDFHARPVYLPDLLWSEEEVKAAKIEVEVARSLLEDDRFHIYGVTHKFDPNFQRALPKRCEVRPLAGATFCADQWVYDCCDRRGDEDAKMCMWEDIMCFWGSEKHWQMIQNLDTSQCHRRCTFGVYQEILDKVFREDKMCRAFI